MDGVTERGILMGAPMAVATLRDIDPKGQTRRELAHQPYDPEGMLNIQVGTYHPTVIDRYGDEQPGPERFGAYAGDVWTLPCPYGRPGDRLYVKETFYAFGRWETRFSAKKGREEWHFIDMTAECGKWYFYAATSQPNAEAFRRASVVPMWWKRPAIFMPRAASRILLEVVDIRVERLLAINEADAIAEGIERLPSGAWMDYGDPTDSCADPISSYRTLWESINGFQSSKDNPWVWVVEFKRITP